MIRLDANGLPILAQFSEEGFVDLVFQVTDLKDECHRYRFHLTASHDGKVVGFNVEMRKGIQGGFQEGQNEDLELVQEHVYHEGVNFFRSGADSDALMTVVGGLYELSDHLRMVDSHTFTAIALHEGPLDFDSDIVNMKLLANDKEDCPEGDYFECYFNVDFANGLAYWNEKDQDYREGLIKGLASATTV
ncbi:MAG TPA: hypothetical protein PKE66_09925 [Pyrinomonadaceae bacterium]|nr:hypothetical protein [Pyrinomonadaceae bacterium]